MSSSLNLTRRAGLGARTFTPSHHLLASSCVLWLDASNSASITTGTGSRVTSWADLSGNSNDVVNAADDATCPTLAEGAVNSRDALLFDDASSQFLNRTSAIVSGVPLTMVAAVQPDAGGSGVGVVAIVDKSASVEYFLLGADSSRNAEAAARSSGAFAVADSSTKWTSGATGVWTAVFASNTSRTIYLDGGSEVEDTTSSTPANLDRTSVGNVDRSSPFYFFSGYICELAVFSKALSTLERAGLESYLAGKWGVTLS